MNQPTDDLNARFAKLIAHRDEDNKPMTQQAMADTLNAEGVSSLTGQAWSKYSVRRMLNKLKQGGAGGVKRSGSRSAGSRGAALSDDEIRARIRQGRYDTEQERFVSLPAASAKDDKKKDKKDKKEKKDKKNKKKK